jgi:hypothetical protein
MQKVNEMKRNCIWKGTRKEGNPLLDSRRILSSNKMLEVGLVLFNASVNRQHSPA